MADRDSYETLWEEGILPLIRKYKTKVSGISVKDNAKELIWQEYNTFNKNCKQKYMRDTDERIDRHKVCACYIYAIVKAHPLEFSLMTDSDDNYSIINEYIAIKTGLSLLRAYIIENASKNKELSEKQKSDIIGKVNQGIRIPDCNHGTYIENFASELHYTYTEGNYNILSLANTLFLLEIHTIQSEVLRNRKKKRR